MKRVFLIITFVLILNQTSIFSVAVNAQPAINAKTATRRPAGTSKQTPSVFDNPTLVKRYQQGISAQSLASWLHFLASDFFEGRDTGTRGQRMAAQYLASEYRSLGLEPKGTAQNAGLSPLAFLQPFSAYRLTPRETRLELLVDGNRVAESVFSGDKHDDLAFYSGGGATNTSGGVVFAGYGIGDPGLGYNDYAALKEKGISINNKWVMMLADEPLADASKSLLPTADRKPSRWTTGFIDKRHALWKVGRPAGILVVSDLSPRNNASFVERAAVASANARQTGLLSLYDPADLPPIYSVSVGFANQILAQSATKIEDIKRQIDTSLKPVVFDVKAATITSTTEQNPKLETENVLALIEGSDPKLKNEVIVVSSHYDHLGLNPVLKGDQIFNGAADDGTGVVASLELAQAFMKAKRDGVGPRRSILFANFSAEERGLLGSLHYANDEPTVPLEGTVANINLDGVGGIDLKHPTKSQNYIYIVTADKLSGGLALINQQVHKITGSNLELTDGNNQGFRSDSLSFAEQLVPFIYFSTGRTEHYHQVSDEPGTIDYQHLQRVTQLIFATVWQVANQNSKVSSLDRSRMKINGYSCRSCNLACDLEVFEKSGNCPMCGMPLVPRLVSK